MTAADDGERYLNEMAERHGWDELVRAARPAIEYVRWAAITYRDNPARQELLDRLNTRWRDGEQPPRRALNY